MMFRTMDGKYVKPLKDKLVFPTSTKDKDKKVFEYGQSFD